MLLLLVLRGSFLTLLILVLVTSSLRLSDGLNLFLGLLFFNMDAFSFLFDDSAGLRGLEGAGKVGRGLGELIKLVSDGVVLLSDDAGVLLLKVNSELIVNERDDHTVMERDHVGRLVLSDLAEGLHENESSIAGKLVLSLLGNEPTLILGISNLGVVSTDSLKLDLDHSLHRAANSVVHLVLRSFEDDLFLDEVLVLLG